MRIAVLYNLPDPNSARSEIEMAAEREVLETVGGIKKSLKRYGHEAVVLKCCLEALEAIRNFDAVFNLAEGFENDLRAEPYVTGVLELYGLPYTGSPPEALELCRNKYLSKLVLEREGIKTPRFQLFKSVDDSLHLEFPVIVKPALEDASIGITNDSLARDEAGLRKNVRRVLETYRQPALVEEYVEGGEMNAALIGEGEAAEVLPISEIVFDLPPGTPRILGFEAKWQEDSPLYQNTKPLCPAPLEPELEDNINKLTRKACSALGVKNYARVDFRVRDKDAFVIEVNPNPCINPKKSGFARAAAAAGMSYPHLVQAILDSALARKDWKTRNVSNYIRDEEFLSEGELSFRRVRVDDIPILFKWFQDAELTRYMDPSSSITEDQLLFNILNSRDKDFIVCKNSVAIGFVTLYNNNGCSGEVSYLIGEPGYRGKGLSKQIVEALVKYGFMRLKLVSIFATASVGNLSSIKALKRAGFKKIGIRRSYSRVDDRCMDELLFNITRGEEPVGHLGV